MWMSEPYRDRRSSNQTVISESEIEAEIEAEAEGRNIDYLPINVGVAVAVVLGIVAFFVWAFTKVPLWIVVLAPAGAGFVSWWKLRVKNS